MTGTVVQLVGLAVLVAAAFLLAIPAGIAVLGVVLVVIGTAMEAD